MLTLRALPKAPKPVSAAGKGLTVRWVDGELLVTIHRNPNDINDAAGILALSRDDAVALATSILRDQP